MCKNPAEIACMRQEIELTAAGRPQLLPEEVELKAISGVTLNKLKRCGIMCCTHFVWLS